MAFPSAPYQWPAERLRCISCRGYVAKDKPCIRCEKSKDLRRQRLLKSICPTCGHPKDSRAPKCVVCRHSETMRRAADRKTALSEELSDVVCPHCGGRTMTCCACDGARRVAIAALSPLTRWAWARPGCPCRACEIAGPTPYRKPQDP